MSTFPCLLVTSAGWQRVSLSCFSLPWCRFNQTRQQVLHGDSVWNNLGKWCVKRKLVGVTPSWRDALCRSQNEFNRASASKARAVSQGQKTWSAVLSLCCVIARCLRLFKETRSNWQREESNRGQTFNAAPSSLRLDVLGSAKGHSLSLFPSAFCHSVPATEQRFSPLVLLKQEFVSGRNCSLYIWL